MDDIFVWLANSSVVEEKELEVDSLLLPEANELLADFSIFHYYYWGVEKIGAYLLPGKGVESVLNWATQNPNYGLFLVVNSVEYQFTPTSGSLPENALVLQTGTLSPETELQFSLRLKTPPVIKEAFPLELDLDLVYSKIGE